jgi:UDP-glucose 4-epimerase
MTIAWVIGSTGLLGAALCRTLRQEGTELFFPTQCFSWHRPQDIPTQMEAAVNNFSRCCENSVQWEIYWAAGIGTMSSAAEVMSTETHALSSLLKLLHADPRLSAIIGRVCFASSAGAIYAGSADEVISENSLPTPTTAYAIEKLRQEELVQRFVAVNPGTFALMARISTLYGPGQATSKKQGLLVYMARSIIRNQPIQIYVPYDTIRDYIDADDAAFAMVVSVRTVNSESRVLTKIIASENSATIAEIVAIFKRLSRRTPLVVRSANKLSNLYSRRVKFKSIVVSEGAFRPGKTLPIGISQLMRAEHATFVLPSNGCLLPTQSGR